MQQLTFHKPKIVDTSINRQPTIGKIASFICGEGSGYSMDYMVLDINDDKCIVELIGSSVNSCIPSYVEVIDDPIPITEVRDNTYKVPLDYIVAAE